MLVKFSASVDVVSISPVLHLVSASASLSSEPSSVGRRVLDASLANVRSRIVGDFLALLLCALTPASRDNSGSRTVSGDLAATSRCTAVVVTSEAGARCRSLMTATVGRGALWR